MNRTLAFAFVAFAFAAPRARADSSLDDKARLFSDAKLAYLSDPAPARAIAARVVESCSFSPFSRIGPRPEQRERCREAERAAIAKGPDAAVALLEKADEGNHAARYTGTVSAIYDTVGKIGDAATIDPLVTALERLATPRFHDRAYEWYSIDGALRAVTFAEVNERAPWMPSASDAADAAKPWRAWLSAHKGRTRAELYAERVADARAHAADRFAEVAFVAARFLASQTQTRAEGLSALRALAARDLTADQRSWVRDALDSPAAPAPAPTASDRRA